MRKKLLAAICIVSMSAGLLTSCGNEGSSEKKEGRTEITFWSTSSSKDEKKEIEGIIERFEKENPDITVKYEGMEGEAYKTKIKTVISSNSLPDVFTYWVGEQFNTLVSSGNVKDITEMYESDKEFKDSFVEGALDAVTYDGKIYGIPSDITCMAVWYNKKIFEENGVEVPETYEELKGAIDQLNASNVTPIVVGGKDRWPFLGWYSYLAQRIGGTELYNEVCQGDKKLTEDAFVKAGEEVRELSQNGFINGNLSLDAPTSESLFAAGKAAMLITGSWSIPTFASDETTAEDFSFFPFPGMTEKSSEEDGYLYGGVANTLAISKDTENAEAAEKFVKFYMSEEEQKSRVERTGSVSPIKVDIDKEKMIPLAYEFNRYVSEEAKGFFAYTDQALPPEESEKLLNALSAIVADDSTDVREELSKVK